MNINVSNIKISYEDVLQRLGYLKTSERPDQKLETEIKECIETAQKLIAPKAVIAFENITVSGSIVAFENGYKIESSQVAKLLKDCFKAYGVAVTIGPALEKKRNEFIAQKETFKAVILDAAGAVAAEEAVSTANKQITEFERTHNNKTSKRFSAGYGDWLLAKQKEFLEWLGAANIGIRLNNSFQMQPEKSVSAVIGVKVVIASPERARQSRT
ncbi:MAG: hypothetical protein FWC57_06345 [Endomicrobia bacterium]|nr:hypothetical protein [Endomicrobiia bacterium]